MKLLPLSLALLLAVCLSTSHIASGQAKGAHLTITENYYKVIPGHQQEFLQLFMKNHYPLLQKGLESGRLLSVKIETPAVYMPEDVRWDYRVTTQSTDPSAHNAEQEAALKQQLWPDQETFKREEKQRFDAVLAHWDVTVTDLTPTKK
jgi:Asp-tRNA(Asn)/Glu-tRNA(Gln) amidotransferase A subunit family amidase